MMIRPIALSILFWLLFLAFLFIVGAYVSPMIPTPFSKLAYGTGGTLAAFLSVGILLKIERKSFKEIGLVLDKSTLIRFVKGVIIGALIFAVILLILVTIGQFHLQKNPNAIGTGALILYITLIPLALMEEIAFRSYPFVKLNSNYGLWITQFIVALAFAIYHILNGWSVYVAFFGPFVWAFVFGLSAAWSGGISMPTGIHFAINAAQNLFGMVGTSSAVWILSSKETAGGKSIAENTLGTIIQLLVLVGAILFTVYYLRFKKRVSEV